MVADVAALATLGAMDDAQLLAAWAAGDRAAGEALFERYYVEVARFFASKVDGECADLVQDTFVGCLGARGRLRDPSRFRGFLFGIAYNTLKTRYREAQVDGRRFDAFEHSVQDVTRGPVSRLEASGKRRELLLALRSIPLQFQVVLELFYWESLTSDEIAQALGEPHGTVRTRLRRARALLRDAVRRRGEVERRASPALIEMRALA